MTRPRLLDLFCCAGGVARGYTLAGFDVVGVDIREQPRYLLSGAVQFVRADALEYLAEHGGGYDAIHASPPCQHYSRATAWRGDPDDHPDLLPETRDALVCAGRPWVIENVEGSPMSCALLLCGTMFGLRVRRHRLFESSIPLFAPAGCRHRADDYSFDHGGKQPESVYRAAMGCDWMTVQESRQAIPPAYAELIGRQLIRTILED